MTWDDFARRLDFLQARAEEGNRSAMEAALLEVDKAKATHNAARDRLAAHLSDRIAALDKTAPPTPEEQLIREKARLLWELSGKPQGSAEADWLGAERLVRSASAL